MAEQQQDLQQIQQLVQRYFDSMYESSEALVREVFHENAKITGYMGKNLMQQSVADFSTFVGSQQPSAKAKDEPILLETLSVEIAGDTAVARVRDGYLGLTFLDTLSLLRVDGRWQIYNKLFHVET
ncbi:MAG TPA: hypothetical protein DER02_09840 [Gammaproteobacteria bacterium]|nr:hypothetical protein [Gammaproteobacteria bacterium]|tara:strand:+ start:8384 stop:8761 length:378 start_codon:yes stop_codon:yes gene_type:complete